MPDFVRTGAFLVLLIWISSPVKTDESPWLIPYQGRITNQRGQSPVDGQFTITFFLYDQAIDGEPVWSERHERAGVMNGMVNVFLGSIRPIAGIDFSETKYLGIVVDSDQDPATPDPEMVPRQLIIPAFFARNSLKLVGHDWSAILEGGANDPGANRISGERIAIGGIDANQIKDGAITRSGLSQDLADGLENSGILQTPPFGTLTATERIERGKAVAVTSVRGTPQLQLAGATAERSAFYGIASEGADVGEAVSVRQFGPLEGFTDLNPGSTYFLDSNLGEITQEYPSTNPVYAGYALSETILYVDVFGVTRNWNSNYWGSGVDGDLNSQGDVMLSSELDGDVVVRQYESLVVNEGHTMTVENRCRGLVVYVNGNCTINGTLTMTARGAHADPAQSDSIPPEGIRIVRRKINGNETLEGSYLGGSGAGGVGTEWKAAEANQAGISGNGMIYTIARLGGSGGGRKSGANARGNNGGTSNNGTGGGGSGGNDEPGSSGAGAAGTCYSGGSGGSGNWDRADLGGGRNGAPHGGPGGVPPSGNSAGKGAGNPSYGTGGLLILFVRGNLSLGPSGRISSNGSSGTGAQHGGGGGSGGGRILILHAGSLHNQGVIQAKGGAGGASNLGASRGGNGGDGSVTVDQIDP